MMYGSKDGNIWGRMSLRIDGARVCMQRPTIAGMFWDMPDFVVPNQPLHDNLSRDSYLKKKFTALNWFLTTMKGGF